MSGELVSEDEKPDGVNWFSGHKEVIMIVNSMLQNHQRKHRNGHQNTNPRREGSPLQPFRHRLTHPSPPNRAIFLRFIAVARDRNPTRTEIDRIRTKGSHLQRDKSRGWIERQRERERGAFMRGRIGGNGCEGFSDGVEMVAIYAEKNI